MTYTPTKWKKGDVVTSVGLNNMEDGIFANDAAISEIHDPANSAIAEGGIGYYDKTTLLNETIPVADWVDEAADAYAEIDVTGIELSAGKKYWIVIDGVATKCDYGEVPDGWFIVPIDPETPFPAIGMNGSDNYSLYLAELPTEPVSFQLIEGEAHKINKSFLDDPFFVAHNEYSGGVWTLEETWNEIKTALDSGKYILCFNKESFTDGMIFYSFSSSGGMYYVSFFNPLSNTRCEFKSNDPDGVLSTGAV